MTLRMRLGGWIGGLEGWRAVLFAFAAGVASATAFAPFYVFPALLLGLAALALLLEHRSARRAALLGWSFAFGQFLLGLHWVGYAFMVDPAAHLWQMPFALLGLCAGLALFTALGCGVAALPFFEWSRRESSASLRIAGRSIFVGRAGRSSASLRIAGRSIFVGRAGRSSASLRIAGRSVGTARVILLAICYAASEWLRGHAFTGFPWNLPAYGWGASWAVMQSASLFGAYGLSFLTLLLGLSLAELAHRRILLPGAMALVFVALWGFGAARLETAVGDVPGLRLRLVQPDIPQREKEDRRYILRNWARLLDLSSRPGLRGAPIITVWPEAATDVPVMRAPALLNAIGLLTGPGRFLITGSTRVVEQGGGLTGYNSLYIFGPGADVRNVYDKSHLVPFGEYVPFAAWLGRLGITKLTAEQMGFSAGDGVHRYVVPGAPLVTPLICYEIIFPGAVTAGRPGWFVNVTDDSWFGPWAGPRQHLLIARVRAIEEGVPIARAANTGISAMIDPLGRITASQDLGAMGVVDTPLPRALAPTFYAQFGDLSFAALLIMAAFATILAARRRKA